MGINIKSERIGRRDSHMYRPRNFGKHKNQKICNIALDTCTVYNLFRYYKATTDPKNWSMDSRWTKKYIDQLKTFYEGNRYNQDGTFYPKKDKKRYVFWLMPTVQEEIQEFKNQELHDFVDKNMLKITIDPEWQLTFDSLSTAIANEYADARCIHDAGHPTPDGYLLGECSILNMTLVSDDRQHLVGDLNNKVYRAKINKILRINSEMNGGFSGCQARPLGIGQFLSADECGKVSEIQNAHYLSDDIKYMLEEKLEVPLEPICEGGNKNFSEDNRVRA